MYNFNRRLTTLKDLGVVGIRVLQVSNERPGTGNKTAGGAELAVQNSQGFIGAFGSRQRIIFALAVEVERQSDLHVAWAEGATKEIRTLGDQTPNEDAATFVKRIPTSFTNSGEFTTKSNDFQCNGVWIINVAGGKLRMWEVAIITDIRDGWSRYYLSLQEVYKAGLFRKDGIIWVSQEQFPGYEGWESLQSHLFSSVVDIGSLKPASRYRAKKAGELALLAGNQARILWFSQSRRYGLARPADGKTVRLHASKVLGQEFPAFEPDEVISFEKLEITPLGNNLLGVRAII